MLVVVGGIGRLEGRHLDSSTFRASMIQRKKGSGAMHGQVDDLDSLEVSGRVGRAAMRWEESDVPRLSQEGACWRAKGARPTAYAG